MNEKVDGAPGYRAKISARVDAMPGASAGAVAHAILAEMTPAQVRNLAEWHLRTIADEVLRNRARRIENASTHGLAAAEALGLSAGRRVTATPLPADHTPVTWNARGRKQCERCGCARCIAALGEYNSEQQRISEGYWATLGESVRDLTDALSQQIRLELTEELLSTEFALGDGSRVTWGTATAADHGRRIELLERNIAANADTAAKHRAALEMLEANSATTLAEVGVAA